MCVYVFFNLSHNLIHTLSHSSPLSRTYSLASKMSTEAMEEFSASNDHMIVKGKRTKRPRHSSSASSSAAAADFNSNSNFNSSPATSSGISTSTEEDEDLANCLILLARGRQSEPPESKFTSRKFAAADAKAGIYVYECKTCNRTFSSFQALGGHRASHKKPKSTVDFDQKSPNKEEGEEEEEEAKFTNTITPPPSNKPKIHECSICGAEFASGQALGGHMRRHRSTAAAAAAARSEDDSNSSHHDHHLHHHQVVEKARSMLSLDLNLPAPPEDDFLAFSTNQQPRLVFTAAALVDCHY